MCLLAGVDGLENLAPLGVRSPDLPARSESLYRLSYPGHQNRILGTTKSLIINILSRNVSCAQT